MVASLFFFLLLAGARAQVSSTPEIRRAIPITSSPASSPENNLSDIRLAPIDSSDPAKLAEAQFAVANGFFSRKQWSVAALEYEKFLQMTTPGQAHRDQALFRLGECQRLSGDGFSSQTIYQQLLKESPTGAMAAAASYRLAEYYQSRKETKSAMESYAQAVTLSSDPTIKNAARYQEALCCRELGEEKEALSLFDQVSKEESPNRNNARLALAETQQKAGNNEEAVLTYQALAHDSSGPMKAEALVKAAMLASEKLQKKELSEQLFDQAAALPDGGEWSGVAALWLMKMSYEAKDYKKTLQKSNQAITQCNLEGRAQALVLSAQAHRQLGELKEALPIYDQVLREYPGTPTAYDALFARLIVLQALHDSALLSQIEEASLATGDPLQRSKIDVLKAETLFQEKKYAAAAEVYSKIKSSSLPEDLKRDALYKEAWSLRQTGDLQGALTLFSQWIQSASASPQMPVALMERASLEQQLKNPVAATADYSTVIEQYRQAPERELALQQKALLQGEQRDNKGMRATFQELLKSYPTTKAEAQANFWIGWSYFEEKEYALAIPFLEKAEKLDSKSFGERSQLRLLLCHYYLEQVPETFQIAQQLSITAIPAEVLQWLGLKAFIKGDLPQADHYLTVLAQRGKTELLTADVQAALAQTLLQEGKFQEAEAPALKSLDFSSEPATRAEALLRIVTIRKALRNFPEADKLVQEALLLQPEGSLNIQARLLQADLFLSEGKKDEAERAYKAVALLTADPKVREEALAKAAKIEKKE